MTLAEATNSLEQALDFLRFIKQCDNATLSHCINVGIISHRLGKWFDLPDFDLKLLTLAGVLHDIGKVLVPQNVLYKPGKLTNEEFDIVKKHTTHGYRILCNSIIPHEVCMGALMHHERTDRNGYPLSLKDGDINKFALMVAVCDVYEAMTADRVYRARVSPFEVIKKLESGDFGTLPLQLSKFFAQKMAEI